MIDLRIDHNMQDRLSPRGSTGEIKIMAIENTKDVIDNAENHSRAAFINELHESPAGSPEAQRYAEMIRENDRIIERVKASAMDVADNVSRSLFALPKSLQEQFMASIAHRNEPEDLVYARVRENYDNRYNRV